MHNVNLQKREIQIGSRTITLETGKLAKQADGSVIVRSGDTVVLVTACHAASAREGIDFLPLTVDYREYTYASGRIPGGFFKREGKPSEKEVLTSRLIDRPIRPLFAPGWRYETQIIALLMSADTENDSDVLAITGSSAALALSEIPVEKITAGVRVGIIDGKYIINPTYEERKTSLLDLIVAGTADGIVMVEAGAKEVTEAQVVGALEAAHAAIKQIVAGIEDLRKAVGKKKLQSQKKEVGHEFYREVEEKVYVPLSEAMRIRGKLENYDRVDQVLEEFVASLPEGEVQRKVEAKHIFHELKEKVLRDEVLERNIRLDGRKFDEIRPIWCEASVLPRVHGSVVFTRGETQALVTCTLGTADDEQKIEHVSGEFYKRFMLHYNFPPFSVGEVQFLRGPGRREVGHGALAERALAAVVPGEDKFSYTIRLVSDILESNGSSSMASVCGGSMAMMDAGVPIKAAVAGHRDGPHHGREVGPLGRPLGHRRRRGPLRRHGLQGGRHGAGHHRAADGHQGDRHHLGDHEQGARPGAGRTAPHPGRDGQDARRHARQHVRVRAADHHHQDPGGQDPRRHRPGRQDDPQHHRAHRREDRRRGQRHGERRVRGRRVSGEGDRHHPGADRHARAEQDLHGQGAAHHRLRRVRRDHARHRRPAARLGDRKPSREGRPRRAEGRPADPGEGDQHRPHREDSPEPQGAAPG